MNVLFVNDTSDYHCGSKLTCDVLLGLIRQNGARSIEKLSKGIYGHMMPISFYDLVIINGEGTFHHDSSGAKGIYELALKFKKNSRAKVCLINTVIQDISFDLSIFDYISTRESFSSYGKYPVAHDPCFYYDVDNRGNSDNYVLFTDSVIAGAFDNLKYHYEKFNGEKRFLILDHYAPTSLENVLEIISHASCVVTGRYHGVVFSILKEKPFLAIESNTHKISGLLHDLNLSENMIKDFSDLDNKIENAIKPKIDILKIKKDLDSMIACCLKMGTRP